MALEVHLEDVLNSRQLQSVAKEDVLVVWQYGSRVYGTNNENSDWDFVVIVKDSTQFTEIDTTTDKINIHIYRKSDFMSKVHNNELQPLMCAFLPAPFVWLNRMQEELDNIQLNFRKVLRGVHKEASRHFHTGAKRLFAVFHLFISTKE